MTTPIEHSDPLHARHCSYWSLHRVCEFAVVTVPLDVHSMATVSTVVIGSHTEVTPSADYPLSGHYWQLDCHWMVTMTARWTQSPRLPCGLLVVTASSLSTAWPPWTTRMSVPQSVVGLRCSAMEDRQKEQPRGLSSPGQCLFGFPDYKGTEGA